MDVSFPNLNIHLNIDRVAFSFFGFDIYWYGIIISCALVLGVLYCYKTANLYNIDKGKFIDILPIPVILGIVGARLYYVVFKFDNFKDNLASIFNLRDGGIAIYGAIIFGAIGFYIGCVWKKINFLDGGDLIAPALLLGQAIGRLGNFVNQEAFGTNTDGVFGMYSQTTNSYLSTHKEELLQMGIVVDPSKPVHPTFLYEMIWCLIGFIFLHLYRNRIKFKGELILMYLTWYGFGRFFIEVLRTDSLIIGFLRVSQIVSLICLLTSIILIFYFRNKIKKNNRKVKS